MLSCLVLFQTSLSAVLWEGLAAPLRHANPNSRPFNRLQPLSPREKSQLLWNQANPASFSKTPGWGVPRKNRPVESATYSLFFPDLFMIWLTPCFAGSVSRCLCGNRNSSPTFSRHSPLSIHGGFSETVNSKLSTVNCLWNQHLQKCIKTNDFNSLYNQHLCKTGEGVGGLLAS